MPCLLPLALLMGYTVMNWIADQNGRVLRINGVVNVVLAIASLVALIYLQATREIYEHTEMFSLSLGYIVLLGWLIAGALQTVRPLTLWAMPALGIGLLVALLPAAMPATVVNSKMPDQFIAEHQQELSQTRSLLSNDLGPPLRCHGVCVARKSTCSTPLASSSTASMTRPWRHAKSASTV